MIYLVENRKLKIIKNNNNKITVYVFGTIHKSKITVHEQ